MFARPANGFGRGDNVIAAEFRRNEMGAQRTMAGARYKAAKTFPWLGCDKQIGRCRKERSAPRS